MKKRILNILILSVAAALLTGCLELSIETGVDEGFTSFLSYNIKMDVSKTDPQYHDILAGALNNFGWYYQEHYGFTAGVSNEDDIYSLTLYKSIENNSLPAALESLEDMLTDEKISAFMQTDMYMKVLPRADSYYIEAMLDLPQIIRLSSAADLPPDVYELFTNGVKTSSGTVFLTLPASQIDGHSHQIDINHRLATMTVPINFSSPVVFDLRGSVVYSEDGAQIGTYDEIIGRNARLMEIIFIAGASLFALLLIILLAILIRIRRHNKLYD